VDLHLRGRDVAVSEGLDVAPSMAAAPSLEKLAHLLIDNLLRRGRGYKNLHYLLLKAQRMAATKT
jgi:hypothetical protein